MDAFDEYEDYGIHDYWYHLSSQNGGKDTFRQLWKDPKRDMWVSRIKHLPCRAEYINTRGQKVILSHAGLTPDLRYKPSNRDYLWDRRHFTDPWPKEFPDVVVVHGHTPVQHVGKMLARKISAGPLWYANNHKVDIDIGAVFCGVCCLLNLDTWETTLFDQDGEVFNMGDQRV